MKIAIIGAGNLGLSIAKGLLSVNAVSRLYLTRRDIRSLKSAPRHKNVFLTTDNAEAVRNTDIVIFSPQPTQLEGILQQVRDTLTPHHLVVSAVAGFKIRDIEKVIGVDSHIIRAIPNTAIAICKSMTCISANKKGKKKIKDAKKLFNKLGNTAEISEELMPAATVICASSVAFWMRVIRASTQGAIQLGFEADQALKLSMHTALGAASLLAEGKRHPEQEIDRVSTPKGCTIEGLNELEHRGLSSSFIKGIMVSYKHIGELKSR